MALSTDPMDLVNLIFCIVILAIGYFIYRKKDKYSAFLIGIAFGMFGLSHFTAVFRDHHYPGSDHYSGTGVRIPHCCLSALAVLYRIKTTPVRGPVRADSPHGDQEPVTVQTTVRFLPALTSSSSSTSCCQVPHRSCPFSTGTVIEGPTSAALT